MTELHVMSIKNRLNEPIDEYLHMFSPERQNMILRHKSIASRNRTVWAELLARHVIATRTGRQDIVIRRENGKPYTDGLHLSISHSGEYVACSVGECPNGVDIERMNRRVPRGLLRMFTDAERDLLVGLEGESFARELLMLWTFKESYAKCTGLELMRVLREVDCCELREKRAGLSGRNFALPDSYIIGVCCDHESLPLEPVVIRGPLFRHR